MNKKSLLRIVVTVACLPVLSALAAGSSSSKGNSASCCSAPSATLAPAQFAQTVAMVDMTEIQLGKVALTNSNAKVVQAFGGRMVADHSRINNKLTSLAANQGIKIPTTLDAKSAATVKKLSALHGSAFDNAYIPAMVAGHTKVLAMVKAEAANGTNPYIKKFAAKIEPIIATHLKLAKEAAAKLGLKS